MDSDLVTAFVLPWAKEHQPHAYDLTIQVARQPAKFATYLARLVELRWESDKQFRLDCPLRVVEETSLVVRLRVRSTGRVIVVKGKRADGEREWSFAELAEMLENGEKIEWRAKIKEKLSLCLADELDQRSQ